MSLPSRVPIKAASSAAGDGRRGRHGAKLGGHRREVRLLAQLHALLSVRGVERGGLRVDGGGLLELLSGLEHGAECDMGLDVAGIDLHRPARVDLGRVERPALNLDRRELSQDQRARG